MHLSFLSKLLLLCTAPFTVAGNGAMVTADGIQSRPEYGYEPPQAFFSEIGSNTDISGENIYRVEDFGAVPNPSSDNRAAIQSAIDAAHAAGGGLVLLQAGTYGIAKKPGYHGALRIDDNVFIKGRGMGETVLRVLDGWDEDQVNDGKRLTGIIRSPAGGEKTKNYGVADLTLDGNRENTNGLIDGFYNGGIPRGTITNEDVWVLRVEARNCSGFGFEHNERNERFTVTDSIAHHNGWDGFGAVYIGDGVYQNCTAYENDRHGFNIVTTTNDITLLDNTARDNGGAGIVVQRGGSDIPSPHNIMVDGGTSYRNEREGVLLLMCHNVEVRDVEIRENGSYGVRIHGSSHVSVLNNEIIDNSRSREGGFAGIQVKNYVDFKVTNRTYYAENNTISSNAIDWSEGLSGKADIQVLVEDQNIYVSNTMCLCSATSAALVSSATFDECSDACNSNSFMRSGELDDNEFSPYFIDEYNPMDRSTAEEYIAEWEEAGLSGSICGCWKQGFQMNMNDDTNLDEDTCDEFCSQGSFQSVRFLMTTKDKEDETQLIPSAQESMFVGLKVTSSGHFIGRNIDALLATLFLSYYWII